VGFLNPASLLFGLSLAALVVIYLRSRARPTINVSSLMLFEEVPAPVVKSRILRLDLLFLLEAVPLIAMTLALADFYVLSKRPASSHQLHALVFAVGAGMSALDRHRSRLDQARTRARELISSAPAGDRFSIIAYALEAHTLLASTSDRNKLLATLGELRPMAVATRPAALAAALLDARGAAKVEIFSDRAVSQDVIRQARPEGEVEVHQFGGPADNVAIVSLDPGVPRSSGGHCVLRNFGTQPAECELEIEHAGKPIVHSTLLIEPRAQAIIGFSALSDGGLIHARLLSHDALAADDERYAIAPSIAQAQALVLSPDADVRDDLARIVLAINPNFLVTTMEPGNYPSSKAATRHFDLAVLHDCSDSGIKTSARMFIFPEPWLRDSTRPPVVPVVGSVALAELQSREDAGALATPALLRASRVVALPGWMEPLASGAAVGGREPFPLAAVGHSAGGAIGVITFDVRNHLLLDPDRMDALVTVIDALKRLLAPQHLEVVATGTFIAVSTFGAATVISPDGSKMTLEPDQWGRVRLRPLQAGRYAVTVNRRKLELFANYYDATESDLSGPAAAQHPAKEAALTQAPGGQTYPQPARFPLMVLAAILVLAESAVLAHHAIRWGARYV